MISLQQYPDGNNANFHDSGSSSYANKDSNNIPTGGLINQSVSPLACTRHHPDLIFPGNDHKESQDHITAADTSYVRNQGNTSHHDSTNHNSENRRTTGFMIEDHHSKKHVAVVGVIDLDPKRFNKIPQYMSEDEAVVNSYLKYHSTYPCKSSD